MITGIPGATPMKPGSAVMLISNYKFHLPKGLPMFGVVPKIVDEKGNELAANQEGLLVIDRPWPGQVASEHKNLQLPHFDRCELCLRTITALR